MSRRKKIILVVLVMVLISSGYGYYHWRQAARAKQTIDALAEKFPYMTVKYAEGTESDGKHSVWFYCTHRVVGLEINGEMLRTADIRTMVSVFELRELKCWWGDIEPDAIMELETLTQLEVLSLSDVAVEWLSAPPPEPVDPSDPFPTGGKHLSTDPETRARYIEDQDLHFLQNLPRLKVLDLSCAKITDQAAVFMKYLTQLEELNLTKTGVGDKGIIAICKRNPSLRKLMLHEISKGELFDPIVTDDAVRAIVKLGKLEYLSLSDSLITKESLFALGEMKSLKHLDVDDCNAITYGDLREFIKRRPDIDVRPPDSGKCKDRVFIGQRGFGPSDFKP